MSKQAVRLLVSILVCLSAGAVGSIFTRTSIAEWYEFLNKPVFTPPNWVFSPIWIILYVLMGVSASFVWEKGIALSEVKRTLGVFILQLALNALWSAVFFGTRSIAGGLVVIILLWLAIIWTIIRFSSISKTAAVLLIPYITWVSFALMLNVSLAILN